MRSIPIIDSHTGGEPTRVVMGGLSADELPLWRRAIIAEPRGHEVIVGALLLPPVDTTCTSGVLFFNNVGTLGMCGHGLIGVVATLHHLGRIQPGAHRFETPVGTVTAILHDDGRVSVRNVLSYRLATSVHAGGYIGDVAWGGNWFFLTSHPTLALCPQNISALLHDSATLRNAIHAAGYPQVDHIEFFAPSPAAHSHSRNFVVCPGGEYDRSPCGTGTSAKLACLAADGLLAPGQVWRQESIIGSIFEATYETADKGIIPTITGTAFITAESKLLFHEDDPFQHGIPHD